MRQTSAAIIAFVMAATQAPAEGPATASGELRELAWIEVTETGRVVTIEVMSQLRAGTEGTYRLEVVKAGQSGRSANNQRGKVMADPEGKQRVSATARVSVEVGANLDVVLTVEETGGKTYRDHFSKTY